MNTARVSFQLGYPDIAAWLDWGLCVSPAGKDSISVVLLLNSVPSQTSKWLPWRFFQELNIFTLLPRESVWGIVCLRFSALFCSFHHPPAAVVPFQVPHVQISSLLLCNAWPCFAQGRGAWLPVQGVCISLVAGCRPALWSLFHCLTGSWFLQHPLLWGALRTICGNVLPCGLWTILLETIRQE